MLVFVSIVISSSLQALLNNSHLYHLAKDDFAKRGIEGEFRCLLQIILSQQLESCLYLWMPHVQND